MEPPYSGWGWARTTPTPAPSGTASCASMDSPSSVSSMRSTAGTVRSSDACVANAVTGDADKQPIKMLNDRLLVAIPSSEGERKSKAGLLIPATAQVSKRLTWAEVVAVGPNVRTVEAGDQVLFNPEDRFEVDVQGDDYLILRERDIHAVASPRLESGSTGLYL